MYYKNNTPNGRFMFSHPEGYSVALEYSYCRGNVGLLCRDFGKG